MRMTDQRRVRRIRLAFIQQGLQPPGRPLKEERFDPIGHVPFLSQQSAFSAQPSAKTKSNRNGREGRKEKCLCSLVFWVPCSLGSFAHFAYFAVTSLVEC